MRCVYTLIITNNIKKTHDTKDFCTRMSQLSNKELQLTYRNILQNNLRLSCYLVKCYFSFKELVGYDYFYSF